MEVPVEVQRHPRAEVAEAKAEAEKPGVGSPRRAVHVLCPPWAGRQRAKGVRQKKLIG